MCVCVCLIFSSFSLSPANYIGISALRRKLSGMQDWNFLLTYIHCILSRLTTSGMESILRSFFLREEKKKYQGVFLQRVLAKRIARYEIIRVQFRTKISVAARRERVLVGIGADGLPSGI